MKVITEPLEDRQLQLTIELDDEETQRASHRAAREISRQVNIPGFRRGKAPYDVIVQRFGEAVVLQEAAEMIAEDVYREALEQEEIEPYAPGSMESLDFDPFTFEFIVPLQPTIDLGAYRDYRLPHETVEVAEEDLEETLEQIRRDNVILDPVERAVQMGDGVTLDLEAYAEDGTTLLDGEDLRTILEGDSTDPAPGFAEALVGMEIGEERTFTLTLTDEFPQEEYRGEEAEFTVTVTEVHESTLPDLDDDLARTIGNFDSLDELVDEIREQMRQEAQQEVDEAYRQDVVEDIVEQAQVAYPPILLEREIDDMVEEAERSLEQNARLSLQDFLQIQGKTMEEFREELAPDAGERLKRALVLGEVVQVEEIEIADEEVTEQIERISARWGARADDIREGLSSSEGQRGIRNNLLASKAVQRLAAIARGEEPNAATGSEDDEEADAEQQEEPTVAASDADDKE